MALNLPLTLIKDISVKKINPGLWPCLFIMATLLLQPGRVSFAQTSKFIQSSNFPYELKPQQEMGLMLTGTGLLYASVIGHEKKEAWGLIPLSRLDKKDLWLINRPVTNNWNPGLNNAREFLEPALSIGTLAALGTYGIISQRQNKNYSELLTLGLMYFEGLYISTGAELLTKSIIHRARPYAYNTDLPLEQRIRSGNNESFPSGNATILFYNATFISLAAWDLFPDASWTPYLIGGSFAIAELSAFWSVRSGMHFPTDVLAGAIWGSGVAYFINRIHRKGAKGLNIMPWALKNGKGLMVRLLF